jgi:hypothetical protein
MKKTLLFVCGLLMCIGTQADVFENAKDAVTNMGVGWNLGNTLDAANWDGKDGWNWASTEEHETYWGQPITKPELIKMMAEAGFKTIRVPVTWFQEMDKDGKVNADWMKRVHEVVDYVIDNDMYCILNVHHDTGAESNHWLVATMDNYKNTQERYEYLWKQIAEEFMDYDEHLLFEAYNEMLDANNTWNEPVDKTDGYNAINSYAKSFVTTVRNTGGNNMDRNLIVNTYSASSTPDAMKNLDLPEESNHIIFQIHSYPNWQSKSNAKNEIDNLINNIKTNLLNRAPVIIGEYATFTTWPKETDYYATDREVALYAMDYLITETKKAGVGTCYWMGMSDGANRTLPVFHQPDLAQTLINAYYGSTEGYKYPTIDDFDIVYDITYTDQWGELFLYGNWADNVPALSLSDYKGIRVEMDDDYSSTLQIKTYGDKSGETFKEAYVSLTEGSKTTTIDFDASEMGSNIYRITLQANDANKKAKMIKATLIKTDGTEVPGTIEAAWGCSYTMEATPKPTGIRAIPMNQVKADGAIFNLRGQRIQKPQKGFYIQDGKTHIAK